MTADNKVLRFGIPKGSLEAQTLELMRKSGWRVAVGDRSYIPRIDDPTLSCRLLRPQEMPRYIADGTLRRRRRSPAVTGLSKTPLT